MVHHSTPRSKLGTDCSAPSIALTVPRPAMRQCVSVLPSKSWITVPAAGGVTGMAGVNTGGPFGDPGAGKSASPSGTKRLANRRRIAIPFITGLADPQVGNTEASPAYRFVT